jgi:hypothetical protein
MLNNKIIADYYERKKPLPAKRKNTPDIISPAEIAMNKENQRVWLGILKSWKYYQSVNLEDTNHPLSGYNPKFAQWLQDHNSAFALYYPVKKDDLIL